MNWQVYPAFQFSNTLECGELREPLCAIEILPRAIVAGLSLGQAEIEMSIIRNPDLDKR